MHSKGADLVIEASGHDSSLAAVLDYVRIGGRVTFVGISIGLDPTRPKPDVEARRFWIARKPETHLFSTETCSMALL
jgi:threonine dehydrogenase-like Zn-dependent dehydrogenase